MGDSIEVVPRDNVPMDAYVISSHTIYKVKTDERGNLILKARIVPHGTRDSARNGVRRDSASAELFVIRFLLSLAVLLGFKVWTADVKGAYMQSGLIDRLLFVRPPRGWNGPRGVLWRLLRLPYGIVEAGRQWLCCIEHWMIRVYRLVRVKSIDQLFIERGTDGKVVLIVAKVTDDFIMAGTDESLERFTKALGERFTLKNVNKSFDHLFLGMSIKQGSTGSITVSMQGYLDRIKPLQLSKGHKEHPGAFADEREVSEYRSLAGSLLYLGQAVCPYACYVASRMMQQINQLTLRHIHEANEMLAEIKQRGTSIHYPVPQGVRSVRLASFSDASHGPIDEVYGQTGFVSGILIEQEDVHEALYHAVAWSSHKQSRVSYSSYGAEILAAADADDRGFAIKCALAEMFPSRPVPHELLIDSKSLFETITTLQNSGDYRLRKTVARMRDSFESQELNVLRWIPGTENYADALTKRSLRINDRLSEMLRTGVWELDFSRGAKLDSAEWR